MNNINNVWTDSLVNKMNEILNKLQIVWAVPFAKEVCLVVATAVLTHLFDMRKTNRERKTKYQDKIGENIAAALTAAREVELFANSVEIYKYNVNHPPVANANAIKDAIYYPAFFADKEALRELGELVSETRKKHEAYLDLMSAAYLYVFERYLMTLALFLKQRKWKDLDVLGLIMIADVKKWERDFDRHLVKRINKPHYKVFSRHGWLWNLAKKYVEKKYLLKTELDKMMRINAQMVAEEGEEDIHA